MSGEGGTVPRTSLLQVAALAALYLIWGSTYLALRYVVEDLPPFLAAGARYFTAGAILFVILRARGAPAPGGKAWAWSFPVGALMFLVGNGFVSIAEREVASSIAALTGAVMPLMGAALSAALGERRTRREWIGLVLGFSGVVIMSFGPLRATPRGLVLLLLSPLGWAIGSIAARRLPLAVGLMSAATQMLAGGVVTFATGLVVGEALPQHVTMRAGLSLVYLVLVGSLVAFSAYTYLLRTTSPPIAMSYAYVTPAVAVALGVVLGAEQVPASALLAGALIAAGVAVLIAKRAPEGVTRGV